MGSYFGYSLAVVDMNGDKLDDLVIGAPLYTDLSNNEGDYETGRIYVVYQEKGVSTPETKEVSSSLSLVL